MHTVAVIANGCEWCGSRPATREHLLPQWLTEVLVEAFPSDDGYDFGFAFNTSDGQAAHRA